MRKFIIATIAMAVCGSCGNNNNPVTAAQASTVIDSSNSVSQSPASGSDTLPPPFATKSTKLYSKVIGWPQDKSPLAPAGFSVERFATNLDNPRWIYSAPNGDVFIAESNTVVKGVKKVAVKLSAKSSSEKLGSSADRITMFRDVNKDGVFEKRYVFATNLNRPLGMLVLNNHFYIANTDALQQFDYNTGDTILKGPGKTLVSLPAGGYNNHWTRNIIANQQGNKIFISVGSGSNAAEHGMENEKRRANILEVNTDGSGEIIYASGLRNPVGMAWESSSGKLWAAVNERDELGDALVPDYITSVKQGGFYGWPYSYFGKHEDPRLKEHPAPELVDKAIVPDLALEPHSASLGLTFYDKQAFPPRYQHGAFIGQHGSWNKSVLAGYKVMFVPFINGRPVGKAEDFLTGFIVNTSKAEVYGRPVGVAVMQDGSLLVADDAGNTVWRVRAGK